MTRSHALGLAWTVSLSALALGPMPTSLAQNTRIDAFGLVSASNPSGPAEATGSAPYTALHLLPSPLDAGASAFVRGVRKNADTLAGLEHVFVVSGDASAAKAWADSLASDAAAVRFDAQGAAFASLNPGATGRPVSVILTRDGTEIVRVEGPSASSFPSWKALADGFASATRAAALDHYNLPKGKNLAVDGYDLVSYHTQNKAQKGKPEFTSSYAGVTYHFASSEHRALFAAAPEKYLPTYGGWCASAMGAKAEKVEIDPKNFKIKDGRLHLFYKDIFSDALKDWNKHEREWEPAADANWKKLTGESPIRHSR